MIGGNRTVNVGSPAGTGGRAYSTESQVFLGDGDWVFDFEASLNFFGVATLGAGGWLSSDGFFNIAVGGDMTLGSSSFGIFGLFNFPCIPR